MDGMKECLHQLSNFLEITSEELIQSLGDSAAFGTLKRLLKKADEVHRVEDSIPEAALKREQRKHALDSAKQNIKAFDAQVKQNRRSLKIDLIQEETGARGMTSLTSTSALVSSTDVKTEFEKEFRQAIEESGLNWMDNTPTQLPVAPAVQEDRERRQMARIRTLLRAEQIRARRLKKIKSKSYRKLLRKKEMQGMQDLIAKLDKEDPDAAQRLKGDLEKKLSSMRLNRQRQARLKWSKAAQRFGGREMRTEISKQSQAETDAKRELIRAIKGVTDNESDASDDDSDTSSLNDNDDIVAQIKKSINSKVIEIQREPPPENTKGLLGMKFMRDAIIKQKADTIDEARHFMESLEKSESEDDGEKNGDSQPQSQQALVASLFSAPEEIICKPKSHQNVIVQQPKCEADPIPGWGDWVGEGVKEKRKRRSAVFGKPAPPSRPSSSAIVHLLEEDALRAPLMKYQVIDVPYPYKSSAEYEAANSAPIGSEWSTLTAHAEAIQPRLSARLGAVVPPIKLAKHLDADKRARIIDAWDNRKKLKHTKARFL